MVTEGGRDRDKSPHRAPASPGAALAEPDGTRMLQSTCTDRLLWMSTYTYALGSHF